MDVGCCNGPAPGSDYDDAFFEEEQYEDPEVRRKTQLSYPVSGVVPLTIV